MSVILISCAPKVFYFCAEQSKVSVGDSIKLHWKARGRPVMVVHEKTSADDPANIKPGDRLIEFMLTFKNSEKFKPVRIKVTPRETDDTIFLRTSDIHGDTLLASGTRSQEDFFLLHAVTSIMDREIIVWHENKMIVLEHNGSSTFEFNDTPVGGEWKLGTFLSPAEKKDPSVVPGELKILISKKHK